MKENQTLLLVERVMPSDQPTLEAAMMDMRRLVVTGGRERTREEFQALLGGSGFDLTKVVPTRSAFQIIEAKSV